MGRNRDEKFRAGTCGPELQLLRTRGGLMKAHGAPGRTCSRLGAWARARLASRRRRSLPCRQRAAAAAAAAQPQHATRRPPEHHGLARRAAAVSGPRVPALTVARRFPAPLPGVTSYNNNHPGTKQFLSRRQSQRSRDHPAKGGAWGWGEVGEKKRGFEEGVGVGT